MCETKHSSNGRENHFWTLTTILLKMQLGCEPKKLILKNVHLLLVSSTVLALHA